jgi:ankyrin repeat protein
MLASACLLSLRSSKTDIAADWSVLNFYGAEHHAYHSYMALQLTPTVLQGRTIHRLLGYGLDFRVLDARGKSILHHVCSEAPEGLRPGMASMILAHNGLVLNQDHDNMTCLHWAASKDDANLVRILVGAGFPVNATASTKTGLSSPRNKRGYTALHAALVLSTRSRALDILLQLGADPFLEDELGNIAAHLVFPETTAFLDKNSGQHDGSHGVWKTLKFPHGCAADSTKQLLKPQLMTTFQSIHGHKSLGEFSSPIDPECISPQKRRESGYRQHNHSLFGKNAKGVTFVHIAARFGDVEALKLLVEGNPSSLLAADRDGFNALYHGVLSGSRSTVEYILNKGNDLQIQHTCDNQSQNALHWAARIEEPYDMAGVIRLLIGAGVDASHKDCRGDDPIAWFLEFWACWWVYNNEFGRLQEILRLLITAGSDITYINELGQSVAHRLFRELWYLTDTHPSELIGILEVLQGFSVDLLAKDSEGRNIMHYAAEYGILSPELLVHLTSCLRLDIEETDGRGFDVWDYTVERIIAPWTKWKTKRRETSGSTTIIVINEEKKYEFQMMKRETSEKTKIAIEEYRAGIRRACPCDQLMTALELDDIKLELDEDEVVVAEMYPEASAGTCGSDVSDTFVRRQGLTVATDVDGCPVSDSKLGISDDSYGEGNMIDEDDSEDDDGGCALP